LTLLEALADPKRKGAGFVHAEARQPDVLLHVATKARTSRNLTIKAGEQSPDSEPERDPRPSRRSASPM
jgi:hypothetical protein